MPITRFRWSNCWVRREIFVPFVVDLMHFYLASARKLLLVLFSPQCEGEWRSWISFSPLETLPGITRCLSWRLRHSHHRKKMKLFAQQTVFCQKLLMSIYLLEAIRDNSSLVASIHNFPFCPLLKLHQRRCNGALTNRWSVNKSWQHFFFSLVMNYATPNATNSR